jgi:hypothetical protein
MKSDFAKIGRALVEIGRAMGDDPGGVGPEIEKVGMGIIGESAVRQFLVRSGRRHMQLDLMFQDAGGKDLVAEIKHQERFTAPPFDGHGLPPWQVRDRLALMARTGIEPWLFIIEPGNESVALCQSFAKLDALPPEEKFTTRTGKRVVYHIDRFHRIQLTAQPTHIRS